MYFKMKSYFFNLFVSIKISVLKLVQYFEIELLLFVFIFQYPNIHWMGKSQTDILIFNSITVTLNVGQFRKENSRYFVYINAASKM